MNPPTPAPASTSRVDHRPRPSTPAPGGLRRALLCAAIGVLGAAMTACHGNARSSDAAASSPPPPSRTTAAAPAADREGAFPAPQAHPSAAAGSVGLYCSVDAEAAAPIIRKFQDITGISVRAASAPDAADVCWTAEPCEMFSLDAAGTLAPYHSESGDRHAGPEGWPKNLRAADGTWYALGRRLRVVAYNAAVTAPADLPASWMDLTGPRWRGRVGMARPGPKASTTALQLAALRAAHGDGFLRGWIAAVLANDLRLFDSDAETAAAVANGQVTLGLTSSDAALHAAESGTPIRFRILGNDGPIASGKASGRVMEFDPGLVQIPQTVGLTKNATSPDTGAVFIDFLLSNEVALLQSMGASRSFGLSPMAVPGFAARCDGADGLGPRGTVAVRTVSFESGRVADNAAAALATWRGGSSTQPALGPDKR